ncbi:MAG: hypothetical protein WBE72_11850 [Terracidiphilus sp.]
MRRVRPWVWAARAAFTAAALGGGLVLSGCGMPGAPQPPSLNLPDRVTDLSATRAGNQVALTWTMPKRNTDKLLLKDNVQARVCRREKAGGACLTVAMLAFAPGADAAFTETLPAAQASGAPRLLTYFVELENRKGRSAGLSNDADALAGEAPAAVTGLSAEMSKDGVLLRWTPGTAEAPPPAIRLERKLLTPPSKPQARTEQSPLAPPPEPVMQTLLVREGTQQGRALDKDIRFGESYAYRAQGVAEVTLDGQKLELAGPFSPPVRIDATNIFPPDAPKGLAAVATAGDTAGAAAIDLSWQPNTEADLAGYIVYRREDNSPWQRISPAQPVVGPGYHDPGVQPGRTYFYAVTAIDQEGLESARSAEAQETVPGP